MSLRVVPLDAGQEFAAGRLDAIVGWLEDAARDVVPPLGAERIDVLVAPGTNLIPDWDCNGYTHGPWRITITVDPGCDGREKRPLAAQLRAMLAHEVHHAMRSRGPGYGSTLGQALVTEGLAQCYEEEVGCPTSNYAVAVRGPALAKLVQLAKVELWSEDYNHSKWFFGSKTDSTFPWAGGLQPRLPSDAPLARSGWSLGVRGGIGRRARDNACGARSRGRRRGGYRRCSHALHAGAIAAVAVTHSRERIGGEKLATKELAVKKSIDPFVKVREATLAHRAKHGCGTWPHGNGALLSTIAATADARRILELGTALGYTALSFAHGAPKAVVDTIERDGEHVRLARANIAAASMDARVVVHQGDFGDVLPTLTPGYDLAFFDGHTPVPKLHTQLHRLLRPRGVLVTANLNHGGTADAVCEALLDQRTWLTAFIDEDRETAISVKL